MKNKKRIILLFLVVLTMIVSVACGNNMEEKTGETTNLETENIEESNFPITIKHELGETILESKPEKVIVFDYGVLDAMDKIGEDIIGLPKKTVPDYLDKYKDDKYVDVGTLQEPNFEKIYELNPDLIIIAARQAKLYEEFVEIAPTVYISIDGANYLNSFKDNMKILGEIFQKEDIVQKEIENIEGKIQNINKKAKEVGKNGLFLMANDGNLSVFGEGSRFGVLYKEFGIVPADENIESSTHGQKISFEYIVEKNPDFLYVMDRAAITGGEISAKQILNNDLIKSTKAYKEDNIIYLDSPIWYVAAGGITATEKMIEDVLKSLE
ncbi:MAG: siderophore ABC transporter substrate-binding protein [Tissierellia bacterium]|nr:siderophore ABC transporter substrate-binding protein [Tissierellia bacterium]